MLGREIRLPAFVVRRRRAWMSPTTAPRRRPRPGEVCLRPSTSRTLLAQPSTFQVLELFPQYLHFRRPRTQYDHPGVEIGSVPKAGQFRKRRRPPSQAGRALCLHRWPPWPPSRPRRCGAGTNPGRPPIRGAGQSSAAKSDGDLDKSPFLMGPETRHSMRWAGSAGSAVPARIAGSVLSNTSSRSAFRNNPSQPAS